MAMDLLLNGEDDLITLVLYYRMKKNKHGYKQFHVMKEEEAKKLLEEGREDIETLETSWRPQTWQTNNSLLKQSMTYNNVSGNSELDWSAYQQNVFRLCLAGWNVTDSEGNPVPPTPDNVGLLPSVIARRLIEMYDEALQIDDDEKKE